MSQLPWALPEEAGTPSAARIRTIEAHAAGEPLRIVVDGLPAIPGATMLEKRRWAMDRLDGIRRALMLEPRGHRDMYGAILTDPVTPDGHVGVLFLHNEGFSTMCGHGVIALSAALRRLGSLPPELSVLHLDTPAGRVEARFPDESTRGPIRVSFRNVPSFVLVAERSVELPGAGTVRYDVAFGGAFYALVPAEDVDIPLRPESASALAGVGRRLKDAIATRERIAHPEAEDLGFLYGVIFVGPPEDPRNHSRNVCVFGNAQVDRSPTGTGVSARAALHLARGELALGESYVVESVLGTTFTATPLQAARVGDVPAVIPRVEGTGYITGRAEHFLDPRDPLSDGVILQ